VKDLIKSVILADCPVKPIFPQKNESSEDFSKRLDGMMDVSGKTAENSLFRRNVPQKEISN
jgi:hypothetical protein